MERKAQRQALLIKLICSCWFVHVMKPHPLWKCTHGAYSHVAGLLIPSFKVHTRWITSTTDTAVVLLSIIMCHICDFMPKHWDLKRPPSRIIILWNRKSFVCDRKLIHDWKFTIHNFHHSAGKSPLLQTKHLYSPPSLSVGCSTVTLRSPVGLPSSSSGLCKPRSVLQAGRSCCDTHGPSFSGHNVPTTLQHLQAVFLWLWRVAGQTPPPPPPPT